MPTPTARRLTLGYALGVLLGALGCGNGAAPANEAPREADTLRQPTDPWTVQRVTTSSPSPDVDASPATCEFDPHALDLSRLLTELVDLSVLARLPNPAYTSKFVSSYDRLADTAEPGSADWFANHDYRVLEAGETETLLDVAGPGVVTRIWSASPEGTLNLYIDGADEPSVSAPLKELLRGDVEPFRAPFAFVAAGGHNLYFPIPFAEHIRVTLSGPAHTYFHISYRAYAEGTELRSFNADEVEASGCVRELVAERLSGLRPDTSAIETGDTQQFELDASADSIAQLDADADGSMLWELRLWPERTDAAALRATRLQIEFDGEPTVDVPLGDFFASGVARATIASLPIGASEEGPLVSRWPMPFRSTARISLRALDGAPTSFLLETVSAPEPWTEASLLFHATWRSPETFASKPSHDWPLAHIEGTGLYVGNVLNVANSNDAWWGEGDEKIYLDGETFPSHFGTGTEDYYGYAWCSNERFSTAYIGQPLAPLWRAFGRVSLYRFQVLDALAFQSSLRFDMEVRHWGDPVDVSYDALSVWYARPGARSLTTGPEASDFRIPEFDARLPPGTSPARYVCGG